MHDLDGAEVRTQADGVFWRVDERHPGMLIPWEDIVEVLVSAEQFIDERVALPIVRRVTIELVYGEYCDFVPPIRGLDELLAELAHHLEVVVADPRAALYAAAPNAGDVTVARSRNP